MDKERIFKELYYAVVGMDEEKAKRAAEELVAANIDAREGIEKGLAKGMEVVGEKFEKLEIFLPELIMAGDVCRAAIEVLQPQIIADGNSVAKRGAVVIGAAKGDIHEIGKDIVGMLLETAGFEVHNLGIDIANDAFIEEAEKVKADIIAVSSLLTTTLLEQRDLIELLKDQGKKDQYMVMVGGGPVTQSWADEIGADGYGETGTAAVSKALELVSRKGNS